MEASPDIDVAYVARLARLNLDDKEAALFRQQLGDVLKYVAKLNEVSFKEPEEPAAAPTNDLRPDEARDWFTADQALSNAPRKRDQLFIVPKVVE
jgi:aspartyl-tRNA(Asn)/glutamyl-tRNA(Gln) amidotransferase subunit C